MRLATACAMVAGVGACRSEKVYQVPAEQAQSALTGTRIPTIAFGGAAQSEPGEAISGGVRWLICTTPGNQSDARATFADRCTINIIARFVPASEGVTVDAAVEPVSSERAQGFARGLAEKPAVGNMFRAIAREQVDATLNHRDFEFQNIGQDLTLALLSMMPEMRKAQEESDAERNRLEQRTEAYQQSRGAENSDPSPTPASPYNPLK